MNSTLKIVLIIGGFLAAALVVSQLVLGQLLLNGNVDLRKTHQHTGYTAVVVSFLYILGSLWVIASIPTRPKA